MRAFGEALCVYRPPVDLKTITAEINKDERDGMPHVVLNFITPHQKWGIHSTYTDNLIMLTLNRGGPVVWISEDDAKTAGIVDNDWIELYNVQRRADRAGGGVAAHQAGHHLHVPRPGEDREHRPARSAPAGAAASTTR